MRQRGFSLVELLVGMLLLSMLGTIIAILIARSNETLARETERQFSSGQTRIGMARAVSRLREHGGRVADLEMILTDDSGDAVVVDGILFWADSTHQTVYMDVNGDGAPDIAGYDDLDGDGRSDVIGYGLRPLDRDGDGNPDFLDVDRDGRADDVVTVHGVTDGYYDHIYELVTRRFDNLDAARDWNNWLTGVEVIATDLVPQVSWRGAGDRPAPQGPPHRPPVPTTDGFVFDVIEVEGVQPQVFDYGHDGVPGNSDEGEGDGRVDELEIANAATADGRIDDQGELDIIGSVRFNLRRVKGYAKGRLDLQNAVTSVAPRAFTVRLDSGLTAPTPVL